MPQQGVWESGGNLAPVRSPGVQSAVLLLQLMTPGKPLPSLSSVFCTANGMH